MKPTLMTFPINYILAQRNKETKATFFFDSLDFLKERLKQLESLSGVVLCRIQRNPQPLTVPHILQPLTFSHIAWTN